MTGERPVIRLEETASTNTLLKEMAKNGCADRTVLIAGRQSAGRGRLSRSFSSPEGGLYLSILTKERPADDASSITVQVGEALRNVVLEQTGIETTIKAPNDLLAGGRKICGILTESFVLDGVLHIIVGVGLNVNTDMNDLPPELRETAASLRGLAGRSFSLEAMADAVIEALNRLFDSRIKA